jgi:hypothetical protein
LPGCVGRAGWFVAVHAPARLGCPLSLVPTHIILKAVRRNSCHFVLTRLHLREAGLVDWSYLGGVNRRFARREIVV